MRCSPLGSLAATLGYLLTGRLHFPRARIGQSFGMADGRQFTIFREAVVDPGPGAAPPEAVFRVRFHVAGMSPAQNKRFSVLPIPFVVGLPGFRSKLWTVDEQTGDFQGIYQWATTADAERYARSFAMRFMTGRSVPGSVSWAVLPCAAEFRASPN